MCGRKMSSDLLTSMGSILIRFVAEIALLSVPASTFSALCLMTIVLSFDFCRNSTTGNYCKSLLLDSIKFSS